MKRMILLFLLAGATLCAADLYVSPSGNDSAPGTAQQPLRTLAAAQRRARESRAQVRVIHVRPGVYYLPETLVFTPADSGSAAAPVTYAADPGGAVVLSGGTRLNLQWTPYRDGVLQAKVPAGFQTDQLFVDGVRQHMARYPNYDAQSQYFQGWAADAFQPAARRPLGRSARRLHARHAPPSLGRLPLRNHRQIRQWRTHIRGRLQNNRPLGMHDKYRYVENVFEELDSPGEWFLNREDVPDALLLSARGLRRAEGADRGSRAPPSRRI